MKTKTYSIYLAKEKDVTEFEDIFKDNNLIEGPNPIEFRESREFGEGGKLFIFKNKLDEPVWCQDVKSVFTDMPELKNDVSYGVIVFKQSGRIFAAAFGHGWQYIDDEKVERDFGLKVAVNLLNASKINLIDSSNLSESMKTISLSPFQRNLQAFGVDDALSLLNRITGKTENDDFSKMVSGATSFRFSKEMNFTDLPSVAEKILQLYLSDNYKNNGFSFIDKIEPIKNITLRNKLDGELVNKIKSNSTHFELSVPGWFGEDIGYYRFFGFNKIEIFFELSLFNYKRYLGIELASLDVKSIVSKHGIEVELNSSSSIKKRWFIKDFLIGSLVLNDGINDGLYAINEGEWYKIDQQFKQSVDDILNEVVQGWDEGQPLPIFKKISNDGKKIVFEHELKYNKKCARKYNQICLDQQILTINPLSVHEKFEACDILDIENKKLIHVKKGSGISSVLSHFFKQGSNSAQIFKRYPNVQKALIAKVRDVKDQITSDHLSDILEEGITGWTVEFHIVELCSRADGKHDIPFFSKVTLRDEISKLKGMGFNVVLKFVPYKAIE